ncbi:MAG: hypothetical protein K0A99_04890 [Desulfoarculaceae bacterium]|nr:hypothetical protein [Desulfoarculaceae bacterium]
MPHPRDSNPYRCFLEWYSASCIRCRSYQQELFLLFLFTDSYATSKRQQSLPLFLGVVFGKLHPLSLVPATLFLLFLFTDSYATSKRQQSLPLFLGVVFGKLHPLSLIPAIAFLPIFLEKLSLLHYNRPF